MNNKKEAEMTLDLLIKKKRELRQIQMDLSTDKVEFCKDSSQEWVQLNHGIDRLADLLGLKVKRLVTERGFIHKTFMYNGFEIVQVEKEGENDA